MFYEVVSKLLSESLLSLYPVFVKNIGLPLSLQTWSRCFTYVVISAFFIDFPFIYHTLTSSSGILLALTTIAHIYTSYRGFELLESGVAYSLFYLYPIMILLIANRQIHPIVFLALFGVFLLVSDSAFNIMNIAGYQGILLKYEKSSTTPANHQSYEGFIMILLAAVTEAAIYFLVRDIKTTNNWNHIFISYFLGAVLLSAYFFVNKLPSDSPLTSEAKLRTIFKSLSESNRLSFSLVINTVIGLFGYLLRFFAITRLDTYLYAVLSYFGIVMAFIYGILINGETVNLQKILGAVLIILSNLAIFSPM